MLNIQISHFPSSLSFLILPYVAKIPGGVFARPWPGSGSGSMDRDRDRPLSNTEGQGERRAQSTRNSSDEFWN